MSQKSEVLGSYELCNRLDLKDHIWSITVMGASGSYPSHPGTMCCGMDWVYYHRRNIYRIRTRHGRTGYVRISGRSPIVFLVREYPLFCALFIIRTTFRFKWLSGLRTDGCLLSTPVLMHGGLLYLAFCLSACLVTDYTLRKINITK